MRRYYLRARNGVSKRMIFYTLFAEVPRDGAPKSSFKNLTATRTATKDASFCHACRVRASWRGCGKT